VKLLVVRAMVWVRMRAWWKLKGGSGEGREMGTRWWVVKSDLEISWIDG
jgi:hypothetical protein